MSASQQPVIFRFSNVAGNYRLNLQSPHTGEAGGDFTVPYDLATAQAIQQALTPGFDLEQAKDETRAALKPLGVLRQLPQTVGQSLALALLAAEEVRQGFDVALGVAESERRPLLVEMRFGGDCDEVAALPWEVLHVNGRFLVADSSIALSRYPEGPIPLVEPLTELPMRVLLVLAEPVDATPILPQEARRELLHGLRSLDEVGAVVVDELRPPTYDTLVEAVSNGQYHVLVFYGHGSHQADSGHLLFEDEYGGQNLIPAEALGRALRNTGVRLVLLGACQSASVSPGHPISLSPAHIWQGTAQSLVHAGIPLAIGMQTNMRVDAALAFMRQFALSLAAGKPVIEAVADGRKPLSNPRYGDAWFIPALYGRPRGDTRLYIRSQRDDLAPTALAALQAVMKAKRAEIDTLEQAIVGQGTLSHPVEIARLRATRSDFALARARLARQIPGGYAPVVSPLYGVPSNPVFVGRQTELIRISQALRGEQPVVIWGTGGLGKTALATEVAHRQSWRFPAGVLWLDCRGGPALDTLLETIGAFCGLDTRQTPPEEKGSAVRLALGGLDGRCLLVWDNAEGVWDDEEVRNFILSLPGNCQTLITTRFNPKQRMWRKIELKPLADEAMTILFGRLAEAADLKAGQQSDLDAISQIVHFLNGHPLALTLVVAVAEDEGLTYTWELLQEQTLDEVAAAFKISYERLTPVQKQLFTRLCVFATPFIREAVAALAEKPEDAKEWRGLVQRALVNFDGARYAYHALLRQYAYETLKEREDPRPVHWLAAGYLNVKLTDEGGTPEEALEEVDQWEKTQAWELFARRASAL